MSYLHKLTKHLQMWILTSSNSSNELWLSECHCSTWLMTVARWKWQWQWAKLTQFFATKTNTSINNNTKDTLMPLRTGTTMESMKERQTISTVQAWHWQPQQLREIIWHPTTTIKPHCQQCRHDQQHTITLTTIATLSKIMMTFATTKQPNNTETTTSKPMLRVQLQLRAELLSCINGSAFNIVAYDLNEDANKKWSIWWVCC